jgi:hypothetical protein
MQITDIVPGAVVRLPDTEAYMSYANKSHNCVIVGETQQGDLLLIPICTYRSRCDCTCVIERNDSILDSKKIAVEHKSFAAYYEAKLVPKKAYIKRINNNEITYLGCITSLLLARIHDGFSISSEVKGHISTAYKSMLPKAPLSSQ